ncbi:MAG: T9SS type A sorting domain-containing protein [Ignavibacteriales bacterium]|nr:T9SS type A sorting domain-containing protein [Ignavibacteriales bacterium]
MAKIVFNLPQPLYFSSIEVNNDSIVIGSNQGLLVSTDKGLSWLAINHGFEGPAFQSFYRKFFRYNDSHFAYDYSLNTMYKLSDTTWSLVEFGPPAELQVVSFAQADDQLYIGTIDRGIWKYIDNPSDVEGDQNIPSTFNLEQNFPNPFNPSTTINFSLLKDGFTTLRIYNILGELKAELVNGDLPAGNHSINFDASKFGSGIYLYTLTSNGNSITKKMTLLK